MPGRDSNPRQIVSGAYRKASDVLSLTQGQRAIKRDNGALKLDAKGMGAEVRTLAGTCARYVMSPAIGPRSALEHPHERMVNEARCVSGANNTATPVTTAEMNHRN